MPRYTDINFIQLLGEVELQGGEHAAVECSRHVHSTFTGAKKVEPVVDPGCGVPSLLDIPYDPHADVYVNEPVMEPDPERIEDHPNARRAKKIVKPGQSYEDSTEVVTKRVLYKGDPDLGADGVAEKGLITVCAYHDGVFAWPRFVEATA
jgi:hypothetical protein